jgi:alpha/beta hydrolase fold
MDTFGPSLSGTRVEPVDVRLADGRRVVGEWVRGPGQGPAGDTAIYFLYGSGYALCSPRTHRRLVAWLSRLTGLPVFSVDYRLAPRYRFPTAPQTTSARAGIGCAPSSDSIRPGSSSPATPRAGTSPSTCSCNPTSRIQRGWRCSHHWSI